MNRILLASILGGIAMFIWSTIAHMALPLGEAGIREIPNETRVLSALQSNIAEQEGLYLFPGSGLGPNPTHQQKSEAMKNMGALLARNPSGLLIYHPAGSRSFMFGRLLLTEFATELLETFLAVYLLSQTGLTTFGARVGFFAFAGILAAVSTNISYWNWYGFPTVYIASYMFTQFGGFICAGVVAALVLKNQPSAAS
jgi:hypothetical protein